MLRRDLSTISKVLWIQLLIICFVSLAFLATKDWKYAEWALFGGFTAFMPNLYFALKIKSSEGQDVRKIVNSFYIGESGKLILTVVLFVLIFQFPDVKIVPLMTSYVSVLSIFWFALMLRDNKN